MDNKASPATDPWNCLEDYCKVIDQIPPQVQAQFDLTSQLAILRYAAVRLGLYDAADYIKPVEFK